MSSAKEKIRSPVEPGDVIGGRYRVERVIASGGMGIIVAGKHVKLNVPVAIKFLHPHVLEGKRAHERFLREVKLAAAMQTQHIVKPYDVGRLENGAPYAVMELLDGLDVAAYAKQNAPVPIADAVEIVVQACDGMMHAHLLGVIHRDLKPHNLFITRQSNGTMFIRVLDFGVCKELARPSSDLDEPPTDLTLTESSVTVGSPLYMAPEQMRASKDAGTGSDIWSLGVVLYELLAGRVPFDGGTVTELCLKVVNEPAPPLIEFRPDVPEDLARIVERCLEKDPHKRFDNMAMLAQALEPFASGAGAKRGWQSQVATGDSLDLRDLPSEVATDSSRERLLESGARPTSEHAPPSSRSPKRWIFAQGLVSGVTLTAIGAVLGAFAWLALRSGPESKPPTTPSVASIATSTSAPTPTPSSTPTPTPTPTSPSISPSHRPRSPAASASASASASAPPFTPPNGAPILH